MAEIVPIKSPSVFSEPPPNKDDFRIPEIRTDGVVVTWTAEEAFAGKCDLDQIDQVKYCEDHVRVTQNMIYWRENLSITDLNKPVGDAVNSLFNKAWLAWKHRKHEAEVKVKLDDFLRAGGSQLHDYYLIPASATGARSSSLTWGFRAPLSSPVVVMSRGSHIAWKRCVNVRVLTPEQKWVHVPIPAEELNDHGAKLRARLLRAGANISVDTEDRKRLLHFILNAQAFDQGGAA